jgi:hypothetical protein
MSKPTRSATQLQALIQERLDAIPDLYGQRTDVQDGGVVWKDPGHEGGPNWTVRITRDTDTYRPDIARIIRQLQMQYDLED